MKINVIALTGRKMTFEIDGSATLRDLKDKILVMEGMPHDQQRYVFGGMKLVHGSLLDQINKIRLQNEQIRASSSINILLVLHLTGGGNQIYHRPVRSSSSSDQSSDDKLQRNRINQVPPGSVKIHRSPASSHQSHDELQRNGRNQVRHRPVQSRHPLRRNGRNHAHSAKIQRSSSQSSDSESDDEIKVGGRRVRIPQKERSPIRRGISRAISPTDRLIKRKRMNQSIDSKSDDEIKAGGRRLRSPRKGRSPIRGSSSRGLPRAISPTDRLLEESSSSSDESIRSRRSSSDQSSYSKSDDELVQIGRSSSSSDESIRSRRRSSDQSPDSKSDDDRNGQNQVHDEPVQIRRSSSDQSSDSELDDDRNGRSQVQDEQIQIQRSSPSRKGSSESAASNAVYAIGQEKVTSETGVKGLPDSLKTNLKKGIHGDDADLSRSTQSTSIIPPEKGHSFWDSKVGRKDLQSIAFSAILLVVTIVFVLLAIRHGRPSLMFQSLKEDKQNMHLERINQALEIIDGMLVSQGHMSWSQEEWFARTEMLGRILRGTHLKD